MQKVPLNALDYANNCHDEFLKCFYELLRFQSVSKDPIYREELNRCTGWIAEEAKRIGLKNAYVMLMNGHPIVYVEWLEAGNKQPTILFYAHYDVQPPDPLGLWQSPSFEPTLRDGKLYARGTADNKSGVFITLKAFESFLSTSGRLPVNIKVLFEVEEKSGSSNIEPFLKKNKDLLKADFLIVTYGTNAPGQPIIPAGIRGIISREVSIKGLQQDLHSGSYGGWAQNPIHVLAKIIASFHDSSGRVVIPGFYEGIESLTNEEKELLRLAVENEAFIGELLEESGVSHLWADSVASLGERMWSVPCIDVNGIRAGYRGIGTKTIIPARAGFKFSARLATGQDPEALEKAIMDHISKFEDHHIHISVAFETRAKGLKIFPKGRAAEAVKRPFMET